LDIIAQQVVKAAAYCFVKVLFLQGSSIIKHTVKKAKATKWHQQSASELMARAIIRGNISPAFLDCTELRQYVKVISGGSFATLNRPVFYGLLKDLEDTANQIVRDNLSSKPYIS
jgi:hypothetical protein